VKLRPVFTLTLALLCAAAAGVSGAKYFDMRQARIDAAHDTSAVVAAIQVVWCDRPQLYIFVTRDGVIHNVTGMAKEAMGAIVTKLPPRTVASAGVNRNCDITS
jgi:hypothetical protein